MKKIKINLFIEYLSPTLILSYFFIHDIFLVLIGISFSLYLLNINLINSFINSINKPSINKAPYGSLGKDKKGTKSDSGQIKLTEEVSKLTLAETIEELGFIPSLGKEDDSEAA